MTAVSYGSSSQRRITGFFGDLGPLRAAAIAVGMLAAALLAASDFTTLRSVVVLGASCQQAADPGVARECVATGGDQHAYALVLLGAAAVALVGVGTLRPRTARAAGFGLIAIGLCVLATALIRDLPATGQVGVVGASFVQARAVAGPALWLELAGAGLAVLGGALTLASGRARGLSEGAG